MNVHTIQTLLTTKRMGKTIEWHELLDSTNIALRNNALLGVAEGFVVGADFQTAGRGRFNREWQSSSGENLLFSVLLRPQFPQSQLPLLNFMTAVAVAESVESYPGAAATLRWSNDVYLNNKKVCGILSEALPDSAGVVIGIGLNANQKLFPPELGNATSLIIESGDEIDRGRLLHIILKIMDEKYSSVLECGFAHIMNEWRSRWDMQGKQISVQNRDSLIHGIAVGVEEDGALCIQEVNGKQTRVYAGDATLHPQKASHSVVERA